MINNKSTLEITFLRHMLESKRHCPWLIYHEDFMTVDKCRFGYEIEFFVVYKDFCANIKLGWTFFCRECQGWKIPNEQEIMLFLQFITNNDINGCLFECSFFATEVAEFLKFPRQIQSPWLLPLIIFVSIHTSV